MILKPGSLFSIHPNLIKLMIFFLLYFSVFDALAVSAAGKNVAILNILIADIGKLEFSDERSSNLLSVAAVNGAVECVKSLNAQFGKYEPKTEL